MRSGDIGYQVIDIHTHVNPLDQLNQGAEGVFRRQRPGWQEVLDLVGRPDLLLAEMDRLGIERLGLVNYVSPEVTGFGPEVNAWVLRYARAAPDRFIPFGSVHPALVDTPGAEVRRLFDAGIVALKVHPAHQLFFPNAYRDGTLAGLGDVYAEAERLRMPVMFHTGTSIFPKARVKFAQPIHLDDVLVDFPQLPVIMAHGGRPLWMAECEFLLRRRAGVYMDISSIPPQRLLDYFPRLEAISAQVLYGSDWPGPGPKDLGSNIAGVLALPLTDGAKRRILRDNAVALFGL